MKSKWLGFIMISIVAFYSCENLNEPPGVENQYSLSFLIDAENKIQKIFIYKALPLNENYDLFDPCKYFVDDAELEISSEDFILNSFHLFDDSDSTTGVNWYDYYQPIYYGNSEDFSIITGSVYELNVIVDGYNIHGSTQVPGDFELYLPIRDTMKIEDLDNLEISWSESENAYFYTCTYCTARQFPFDSTQYITFPKDVPRDGTYSLENHLVLDFYNGENSQLIDSIKIYVSAYDENTYNHSFLNYESAGIQNAFGLFGSSVSKTAIIIIDKN